MPYHPASLAAWKSFLPVSPSLDDMIIAVIKAAAPDGATREEIVNTTDRSLQAVSGNVSHLKDKMIIKESGIIGLTASGRKCARLVMA